MSEPHKCPVCEGRRVQGVAGPPCKTCDGTGVVWSPEPQEAAVGAGESPLDINGL